MRKTVVICLALMLMVGCAHKTAPLPQGATNAADATSYRVLVDAHTFLQSIRDSVAAGKIHLNATQKTAFNDLIVASNAADAQWELCHAGNCTPQQQAALNTQVTQLETKLTSTQTQIGGTQ